MEDVTGTLNIQLAEEIFTNALDGARLPHDIDPERLAEVDFGRDPFVGYFYDSDRKESVVIISNHQRQKHFYIRNHQEGGKTQYRIYASVPEQKVTMVSVLDALKGWDGDRTPEKIPDLSQYRLSTS